MRLIIPIEILIDEMNKKNQKQKEFQEPLYLPLDEPLYLPQEKEDTTENGPIVVDLI